MAEGYRAEPEGLAHRPEGSGVWWTFQAVQDRLVEAWGFQRAVASVMPAGARASDGPWHLVIRDRADMAEQSLAGHELVSIGRATLRPEEVDRMDEALGWVVHVRADDVKLLALAIGALERSGHRIAWSEIAPRCGLRTKLRATSGAAWSGTRLGFLLPGLGSPVAGGAIPPP